MLEETETQPIEVEAVLKPRPSGIITMGGIWLLVSLFALTNGGYPPVLSDLRSFVTGGALSIVHSTTLDLATLAYVAAMTSIMVPIAFIVMGITTTICGKPSQPITHSILGKSSKLYLAAVGAVVGEELFARLLFLGAGLLVLHGQFGSTYYS